VVPERETKSVSVEGTYDTDLTDLRLMEGLVGRQAVSVSERLRKSGLSGRTITLKVRLHDFTTLSRSTTLNAPTDAGPVIGRLARGLLRELDLAGGVRLRGVGVSGLADWIREALCGEAGSEPEDEPVEDLPDLPDRRTWVPGMDVVHETYGRGWVWGAGRGIVTVRFETAETPPG